MLLSQLLEAEIVVPNAYSFLFGKALGEAMADIKEDYNSINFVHIIPAEVTMLTYPGSSLPIATAVRKHALELKLPVYWKFYRGATSRRAFDHDYNFNFSHNDWVLVPEQVKKGILSIQRAMDAYLNGRAGDSLESIIQAF